MNTRSQSKIRQTQQLNLLSEQRYFANKSLVKEDVQRCFKDTGIDLEKCPSCKASPIPGQTPDLAKCKEELEKELKNQQIDTTKVTSILACITKELGIGINNIPLPDINIGTFPGTMGGRF